MLPGAGQTFQHELEPDDALESLTSLPPQELSVLLPTQALSALTSEVLVISSFSAILPHAVVGVSSGTSGMLSAPRTRVRIPTFVESGVHDIRRLGECQALAIVDETWTTELVSRWPPNLAEQAHALKALQRVRGVATPHDLLRGAWRMSWGRWRRGVSGPGPS